MDPGQLLPCLLLDMTEYDLGEDLHLLGLCFTVLYTTETGPKVLSLIALGNTVIFVMAVSVLDNTQKL